MGGGWGVGGASVRPSRGRACPATQEEAAPRLRDMWVMERSGGSRGGCTGAGEGEGGREGGGDGVGEGEEVGEGEADGDTHCP